MLTFFRKIRKSLIESGSARKHALYAVGEILLVVIGILIALQINNWNEGRKAGLKETQLLEELETNLDKNIVSLQRSIDFQNFTIIGIENIITHLQKPNPNPNDSLLIYYDYITWFEQISVSASSYEALKNNGFDIIRNKDITNRIIELFEVVYPNQIKASDAVSPVYGQVSLQIGIKHKHIINNMLSSDHFTKDDTYFELLNFMERKKNWKKDFLRGQERLLEETVKLKAEIANYLSK
jgi:hypothetical protein